MVTAEQYGDRKTLMITPIALFLISVGYLLTLFAIAHIGDRNPQFITRPKQVIVNMRIAINLSAWSFYGTTAQAVELGWYIPPTFVGGALLIGLAFPFLKRLVRVSKQANITSIADFIASRHGKSQALAITVTLVALVCLVPYVALQLKAVAVSFDVLTDTNASFPMQQELAPVWRDTALLTALLLAVFAIMFRFDILGDHKMVFAAQSHGDFIVKQITQQRVFKLKTVLGAGNNLKFGFHPLYALQQLYFGDLKQLAQL